MKTGKIKKSNFLIFSAMLICALLIMFGSLTDISVYAMTGITSRVLYADKASITMKAAEYTYITVIDTSNTFNGTEGELRVSSTNSSVVYVKSQDFSDSGYNFDDGKLYDNMYLIKIEALDIGEASIRIMNCYGDMLTIPVTVDGIGKKAIFGDAETVKFTYKDDVWSPSPSMLTFDISSMINMENSDYYSQDGVLQAKLSSEIVDLRINSIELTAPEGISFSEDSSAKTHIIVAESDIYVNMNDAYTVSVPVYAEADYAAEKYINNAAISVTANTDAGSFSHEYDVKIIDSRKQGSVNPDPDVNSNNYIRLTTGSVGMEKDLTVSEGEDVVVSGKVYCRNLNVNGGTLTICSDSTLHVLGDAVVSGGSTNWLNPLSTDKCGGVLEVNGTLQVNQNLTISEPCGILNMRDPRCSVTVLNDFVITTNSTKYTCTLTEGTLKIGGKFESSGKYKSNFRAAQNHLTVLSGSSFDIKMDKSDSWFNNLALSDGSYESFLSDTNKELYSANIKGRFYKLSDKKSDLTKFLSDNNPVERQLQQTYNGYLGSSDFKTNMSSLKKYVSSEFFDKIVADTMFFCDMENMAIAANESESSINFAQWFKDISFVGYFTNGSTVLTLEAPNEPTVYVHVAWLGQSIGSKRSSASASLFNVRYVVDLGNDKYKTGDRICTLSYQQLDNIGNSLYEIYEENTNTNTSDPLTYIAWFKKYVLASYSDMNTIFNAATGTDGKLDLTNVKVITSLTEKVYKTVKNKNLGSFAINKPDDVAKLPKKITEFFASGKSAWDIAVLVSCPVDVVVKDSTGAIVAYVSDNKVKVTSDEAEISVIGGDQKYIHFGSIGEYTVELTGTDTGTMSYYVYELDSEEINRTLSMDNIPLSDGIVYKGKVNSITDCSAAEFSLTDTNGEKYSPETDVPGGGGGSSSVTSDYTYTIADGEVTVTKYNGKNIYVTIPDTIEGYPVTKLGDKAFYQNTAIKTVTFGSNIRTLGSSVFYGCTSLREVCANDVLESFGSWAFCDCTSLRKINIPKGITSMPSFSGCSNVTVTLNTGFTEIRTNAFYDRTGISSVIFPDSLTTIGDEAFYGCSDLTSITIPSGVTSVGQWAFSNCKKLETLKIQGNVKFNYRGNTFGNCINLKNVIFDGIEIIPSYLFEDSPNLDSLTKITIPNTVTEIGYGAFSGCKGLTSIVIPDSVTTIGARAFANCTNLETINIPRNTKFSYVGGPFKNCSKLKNVKFDSEIEKFPDYIFYGGSNLNSLPSDIIPETVTEIGKSAFRNCSGMTSIVIPSEVAIIGEKAFCDFKSLETINIPKNAVFNSSGLTFDNCTNLKNVIFDCGIEKIPDYLFYGSSNLNSLTNITIPNTVTSIGYGAFHSCNGLTSITISDRLTTINKYAFGYCSELTSIVLPSSVTSIESYAFTNCTNLETINIPKNVVIDSTSRIFSNCINLNTVTFDSGIEKIPDYLFWGSSNLNSLTSITIPESVTEIGEAAFSDCTGLTSINLPSNLTNIGNFAFSRCTALTSITIPNSVTSIAHYAFEGCTELTSITIPSNVIEIGDMAFRNCTALTSITIPSSVTGIGIYAFSNCPNLTIYGETGSYAEKYAAENNIPFVALTPKPKFTSVTPGVNSISLKWNAIEGATSYRVHYRLTGSGSWSYVNTTRTSLTLSNLTGGKKYDLVVRYSNGTALSSFTSADIVTATPLTASVKPKFTSVTPGVNSISLKWNAIEGATSYRVHYRLSGSGTWSYVNTTRTSLTLSNLTGGKKYDLVVRYSNGTALSSFTSADIVTATPLTESVKPQFTSVTPGVNSVVLRWNAVEGATSYRVFYRINGTSKWSYKNTTKNAMNLTGLTGGKKYDLLVRSYNGSAWSTYAASDIKTATPTAASSKPVISSVTPGVNSAVLRWNAVDGAKSYRVYYRVSGTSKWSYKNTTRNAMNLTGLTGGKTYEFLVRSYDGKTWTAYSSADIVKATIKN